MNEDERLPQPQGSSTDAASNYVNAVAASISGAPRRLKDGTPVTSLSKEEVLLLTQFLETTALSGKEQCLRAYFEFPAAANPYVVSLLGWRPHLQILADEAQRPVVFAAPSTAAAQLSARSLKMLAPMEFLSWGEIATLYERQRSVLTRAVIIGDLDMPDDNSVAALYGGGGAIGQEQVIADVLALARGGHTHMVCFHRQGWQSPFDLEEVSSALSSPPQAQGGMCFVATACYGVPAHPTVVTLRRFRDRSLTASPYGRALIRLYESASPPLARWLLRHPHARRLVRDRLLDPLARLVRPVAGDRTDH